MTNLYLSVKKNIIIYLDDDLSRDALRGAFKHFDVEIGETQWEQLLSFFSEDGGQRGLRR